MGLSYSFSYLLSYLERLNHHDALDKDKLVIRVYIAWVSHEISKKVLHSHLRIADVRHHGTYDGRSFNGHPHRYSWGLRDALAKGVYSSMASGISNLVDFGPLCSKTHRSLN